ncbi:MAG: GGDEF domain-containing protein [Clostridium sp.]|nr:GGDEF domain-containing protein [Clostridium sp.]
MNWVRRFFNEMLEDIFVNMTNRLSVQLRLICIAAAGVAVLMTVLNITKMEYRLGMETGISAVFCFAIYAYTTRTKKYLAGSICMVLMLLVFFTLYLAGGLVEGFAALWFCFYPLICFFILEIRLAIIFSAAGLAVLIAFLWTPLQNVLPPVYTQNFMLRFPFLYVGHFVFALALNGFYVYTYSRLQELRRKFEILSNQDGLTRLSNRTYLEGYKRELLERGETFLWGMMLDVDFFKQYNDTFGHLAGDEVLKSVAGVITQSTEAETTVAVRYGGEEFLILLEKADKDKAVCLAETLRGKVRGLKIPHVAGGGYVSVSIGISVQRVGGEGDFQRLLKAADDALYRAKLNGRNCISF